MFGAIEMRTEAHPLVGNLAKRGEAENLVAAGIGENRAWPGHELVQATRSEEHTSELQSRVDLVCRLLLEKKKRIESASPNGALARSSASRVGCRTARS